MRDNKQHLIFKKDATIYFPDMCVCCEIPTRHFTLKIPFFTNPELSASGKIIKCASMLLGLAYGGIAGLVGGAGFGSDLKKRKIIQTLHVKVCEECLRKLSREIDSQPETPTSAMVFQVDILENSCRISSEIPNFLAELAKMNQEVILSTGVTSELNSRLNNNLKQGLNENEIEACWFCTENDGGIVSNYDTAMHKIINNERSRKKAIWLSLSASFPRCERCKNLHAEQLNKSKKISILGAFFGAILLFLIAWVVDGSLPTIWEILSIIVIGGIIGFGGALVLDAKLLKLSCPVRVEQDAIDEMKKYGWEMGEAPKD